MLNCLRRKSWQDIVAKQNKQGPFAFVPTIDDQYPFGGDVTDAVPVLLGNNANEGFWGLLRFAPELFPNRELTLEEKTLPKLLYNFVISQAFPDFPPQVRQSAKTLLSSSVCTSPCVTHRHQSREGTSSYWLTLRQAVWGARCLLQCPGSDRW